MDLRDRFNSNNDLVTHVGNQTLLSRDVATLICNYSAIRQAGNGVAHDATQDDIRQAVLQQPEGTGRSNLMRVFKFVYGVDV